MPGTAVAGAPRRVRGSPPSSAGRRRSRRQLADRLQRASACCCATDQNANHAVVERPVITLVVAQATAPQLCQHCLRLLTRRRPGVVDGDGTRLEPDMPAAAMRSLTPVDLLEIHEV